MRLRVAAFFTEYCFCWRMSFSSCLVDPISVRGPYARANDVLHFHQSKGALVDRKLESSSMGLLKFFNLP